MIKTWLPTDYLQFIHLFNLLIVTKQEQEKANILLTRKGRPFIQVATNQY